MHYYRDLNDNNPYLDELEYVIFDFETTGAQPILDEIVEIGALRVKHDGSVLDTFHSLVNPGCRIPEMVIRIHGIRDEEVEFAPSANKVIENFVNFARAALLVAHNAKFDGGFLQKYLQKRIADSKNPESRVKWNGIAILDTVTLSRSFFPGLPSYSLQNLKNFWGIDSGRAHRALEDATATVTILTKCLQKFRTDSPMIFSFQDLWRKSSGGFITGEQKKRAAKISNSPLVRILEEAAVSAKVLQIQYKNGNGERSKREIIPRRIFSNLTEVYVEAHCRLRGEIRIFRVDRIDLI